MGIFEKAGLVFTPDFTQNYLFILFFILMDVHSVFGTPVEGTRAEGTRAQSRHNWARCSWKNQDAKARIIIFLKLSKQ
jgi:hypothetical protein